MGKKHVTDVEGAYQGCVEIAESIECGWLRKKALALLGMFEERFKTCKGSDYQHHCYMGGLIVHTYNVTVRAVDTAKYYDKEFVSLDVVKFSALFHDIGKLFDYKNSPIRCGEHSPNMGQYLFGHGVEGLSFIEGFLRKDLSAEDGITDKMISTLIYPILNHMGDNGTKTYECIIIADADRTDSYLNQEFADYSDYGYHKIDEGRVYLTVLPE